MPSSCKDIRAALAECLQNSDCVMVQRNKPSDCIRPPLSETLPTQCQQLKRSYGQCKRGMVDMRKRFRGNAPIGSSKEVEGSGRVQLYGGRPMYPEQGVGGEGESGEGKKE
ncbi:uncharacterized protein LAJ45_09052 [Morchella importuna]|uniref:Cytochrome c oxidase assembly protein PET191 n=1 Tax=Morchella conica CCBAS932 TaxID=1392247 RepID=A0A3N4KG79_9PEZI|nr:uncharacterized protein LAJ45_09052 [Morchella importuna]KAH8146971.1 hypothetical protein LAJ45_09052 [Morchella importuna]RPB09566.1 hypothetical protein P167DRAFT_526989 [Morchella conica CCBAS932]